MSPMNGMTCPGELAYTGETHAVYAQRKKLWDDAEKAENAYIEAVKRLGQHIRGIIQNPVNVTPEQVCDYTDYGKRLVAETVTLEMAWGHAIAAIVDHAGVVGSAAAQDARGAVTKTGGSDG